MYVRRIGLHREFCLRLQFRIVHSQVRRPWRLPGQQEVQFQRQVRLLPLRQRLPIGLHLHLFRHLQGPQSAVQDVLLVQLQLRHGHHQFHFLPQLLVGML